MADTVLGDVQPVVPPVNPDVKPGDSPNPPPNPNPTDPLKQDVKPGDQPKPQDQEIKYELKAPEGVNIDGEALTKFTDVSKELKIAPESAQKLIEWYGKNLAERDSAIVDTWTKTNEGWVKDAKTDKEFGGEKYDKSVGNAKATINKFGTPQFVEALNITGMGNHPEMIRFLTRVASAIGEDNLVQGSVKPNAPKSAAEILFPTQGK